eukprot:TRINITY_DN14926_c0_g1_i1.p1 TRINITY_DN14926_c0_g1~~TRINITY_DN14926_c0_g1_i1.p1  ORF type:complete len:67 (-),score=2.22 TRINITY_DN14926_c0_g1_i1:318-518(-)
MRRPTYLCVGQKFEYLQLQLGIPLKTLFERSTQRRRRGKTTDFDYLSLLLGISEVHYCKAATLRKK